MKSVAIKDKRKFEIKEIEEPKDINGYVIVEVLKTGICGSDIHYFENGEPKGLILGHEFCAKVISPGNRKDLKVGSRVTALPISPCLECSACLSGNMQYCSNTWTNAVGLSLNNPGGLTEKIAIRPDMVVSVDDNIEDEEVAMVEPTAVALHAVNLASIKVGDKVLVVGGGVIGLLCAMFLKKAGASYVLVSEVNNTRGSLAVKKGVADEYINAMNENFLEEVIEKSNGGFDKVIECCGNSAAVTSSIMSTKPGGSVILVGVATGNVSIPTVVSVMRELTLKGAIGYTKEEFEMCIDLISKKQIDVKKFITKTVSLDEVEDAYVELTSPNTNEIKILVDPKL